MRLRVGVIGVACVATAAIALPATAGARTKTVFAGTPPATKHLASKLLGNGFKAFAQKYQPGVNAFSNQTVTINQGDTVKWVGLAANFHTVDLPGPGGQDLPLFVPGATVTGVNDFAGNPFWFNNHVPSLGFNPKLFAPIGGSTYNGSARIDSGLPVFPSSSNTLKVTFTKPGVYKYFCDIHANMFGFVVVRAKGKPVPSGKEDAAALTKQLTTDILAAKKLPGAKLPKNHVSLGMSTSGGLELYAMFPATLHVKAGTVVTFAMSRDSREVHTAAFGPASYRTTLANSLNGPAIDQQALYPSSSPQLGPIQLSPTSHGNGFANTGGLDRDNTTPLPASGRITFTTPGTYHYQCLIHPFMHGTIIVK
jgi:plastocyanin